MSDGPSPGLPPGADRPAEPTPVPDPLSGGGTPAISVIVPSYNSRWTIPHTLESLRRQEGAPPFEVRVVDSSDDGTGDLLEKDFPDVDLHRMAGRTFQGRARNLAARAARGGVLAFIDADCVADPHWVRRIGEAFADPAVQAVGGVLTNANPKNAVSRAMFVIQFHPYLLAGGRQAVGNLPANNLAYRRDLFLQYGGFPESMGSSEETLLHNRFREDGVTLWFDPGIRVAHFNLDRWGVYLGHQAKQGRFYRIARFQADLPGSRALNSLLLTPLFPVYRFFRCLPALLREVKGPARRAATAFPLLAGLVAFSWGEVHGHLTRRRYPPPG
ncbi:MAG: glycosyltransferase [Acidobacteria bacterium]|nr:glycosyltransferase [Acidobacteriota bacterium]